MFTEVRALQLLKACILIVVTLLRMFTEVSALQSLKANSPIVVTPSPIIIRLISYLREFGIRKGLKKLVISSKIRIFIGENQ